MEVGVQGELVVNSMEQYDAVEKFGLRSLDMVSVTINGFSRVCEQRRCMNTEYNSSRGMAGSGS